MQQSPFCVNIGKCEALKALLPEKEKAGKRVAAICAAPMVLAGFGMLEGKKATIYPGGRSPSRAKACGFSRSSPGSRRTVFRPTVGERMKQNETLDQHR